jgi:AraC family ethanolamine operon transcriptional activator
LRARNYSGRKPHFTEFPGAKAARTLGGMATILLDPHGRRDSRRALVARAISELREHITEPVTMAELSRRAGVSERTLRAAFHEVVGVSPKQFAIAERLKAARKALCDAPPGTTTVTDVATAHGFYELGRFAGRYRNTFGEVPSRTLQHATERQSGEAA